MRLFICGDQSPEYIRETLEYLDERYEITEICGAATSRCMDTVVPWAEEGEVPITLYLPFDDTRSDRIALNRAIIDKERPYIVLIYTEDKDIVNHLIKDAANSKSVEYVIREIP